MTTPRNITPFLWLDGCAREAADFYVSTFKDSRIVDDFALPADPAGGSHSVSFILNGQQFFAFDGHPAFDFTPAISFVVNCDSQEEIDEYWERLSADGEPGQCGWIQDKFGVHWQIIPAELLALLQDQDRAATVLNKLLTTGKIEWHRLRQAYKSG